MSTWFLAREAASTAGFFSFVDNIELIQGIFLLLGLILLIVEIFVPGFGFAGGSGTVLIIIGIILTADNIREALIMFLILVLLLAGLLTIVLRSAGKGRLRKMVLQSSSRKEDGYSTSNDPRGLIGKTGKTTTYLRPSGSGVFEGVRLDIVANGTFIDKGTAVRIVDAYGSRIVVEVIESDETKEPDEAKQINEGL